MASSSICLSFFLVILLSITVVSSSSAPKYPESQIFNTEEHLSVALARYTADLSNKFVKEKGLFTVVLSGGTLIDALRKLLEPPYLHSVDWAKWHIFWVDERVVPRDNVDSNYKLAYDGFLSKVPIPDSQIYGINDAFSSDPKGAAHDYEKVLRQLVKTKVLSLSSETKSSRRFPVFDLMLLGMGPDGHLASLFPEHPLLKEKKRWVTYILDSPKPPPRRITFTFPVINLSTKIAMVVTGTEAATAVGTVFGSIANSTVLPAEILTTKVTTWFMDKEAASKI
ncbi:6-phosphogluconolactonase [Ranunculus cassubicifolius]